MVKIPHFVGNPAVKNLHFVGISPLKTVHFVGVLQNHAWEAMILQ